MTIGDQQIAISVFDQASEAMMITDAAEKVVRVNRQFIQLTGYDPTEVIGQTPAILRSGKNDPHFFAHFWEALNSCGRWQGEIWNRKKNGRLFVADLSVTAIVNHYNKVTHYLAVYHDITTAKEDQMKRQMQESREPQTFLLNRQAFFRQLSEICSRPTVSNNHSALLLLNLDRFRDANDLYGIAAADSILHEAARRLRRCLRDSDLIGRMDGDEFAVILPELGTIDDVEKVAAKIMSRLLEAYDIGAQQEAFVSCSIGIATFPERGDSADGLLRKANRALRRAKQDGGRQYQLFEELV